MWKIVAVMVLLGNAQMKSVKMNQKFRPTDVETHRRIFYIMNYNQSAKDMFSKNVTEEFKEPSTIKIWRFKLNQSKVVELNLRGKPEVSELLQEFSTDLSDFNFSVSSVLKAKDCKKMEYTYKMRQCVFIHAWASLSHHHKFRSVDVGPNDAKFPDFVINPLTRISSPTFDSYLIPMYREGYYLVTRDLGRSLQWDTYIKPLSFQVWLLFIAFVVLSFAAYHFAGYLLAKQNAKPSAKSNQDVAIAFMSIVFQQPTTVGSSLSLMLIFATAVLYCYVMIKTYSAVIMSYVTIVTPFTPFRTLEEAIESRTFKFAIQTQVGYDTFKNYTDTIRRGIYEKISVFSNKTNKGLGTICYGNYMVGMTKEQIQYWNTIGRNLYGHCKTADTYIGPYTSYQHTWLSRPLHPHRSVINLSLMKLQESGSLQAFYLMKYRSREKYDPEPLSDIEIFEVSPIFAILGFGMLLSLLFLTMERITWQRSIVREEG